MARCNPSFIARQQSRRACRRILFGRFPLLALYTYQHRRFTDTNAQLALHLTSALLCLAEELAESLGRHARDERAAKAAESSHHASRGHTGSPLPLGVAILWYRSSEIVSEELGEGQRELRRGPGRTA